jgi:chromosome segregation ATPase
MMLAQSLAAVAAGDLSGLARQVLFEEAKLRSIEALRAEGEEQSEARSRVDEIEAQLRETQIFLEETERQREQLTDLLSSETTKATELGRQLEIEKNLVGAEQAMRSRAEELRATTLQRSKAPESRRQEVTAKWRACRARLDLLERQLTAAKRDCRSALSQSNHLQKADTEYLDEYRPTRDADDEVCIMCNTSSHIHTHRITPTTTRPSCWRSCWRRMATFL